MKRINRRTVGRAFERWCVSWLTAEGWSVHLCGRKAMMIGPGKLITAGNDILGADLVAVKSGQLTLFVQATMDSSTGKRLDEIKKYGWDLNHQRVELWQKKPGGAVVIQRFTGEQFIETARIIRGKFYSLGKENRCL